MLILLTLLIATVSATPTITFSRTSATTITSTLTTTASTVDGLIYGYRAREVDDYISNGLLCSLASVSSACTQFSCTSASNCVLGSTSPTPTDAFTALTVAQTVLTATRDVNNGVPIDTDAVFVSYQEFTGGFSVATSTVTSAVLVDFQSGPLYTVATPTFGLTFSRPSQTTLGTTIIPAAGQTVMLGWKASALAPVPADGIICTLAATGSCIEFTCTFAAATAVETCTAPTTSILTSNTVTNTSAILVRNLVGGTFSPVVNPMHLAWVTAATLSTAYTPASAQNQAWTEYSEPLPTFNAPPSFTVAFSRPAASATTLNISIVPPAGKTIYFGWRTADSVNWPTDAFICAGTVPTCLDVSCTAANTCVTRQTTIYTTNTVTATTISLARPMASGNFPLTLTGKMWLAYDTADTATGTTTLNAASAQSRTWALYSADIPAQSTNNAKLLAPSIFAVLTVLYYIF